jgi:hypothetical protein
MSCPNPLPIPWTPCSAPARVTPAKPRIKPTPSGRPTAPHPLTTLPPRALPTAPTADPVTLSPAAPTPAVPETRRAATVSGAATSLTAAVAVRHGPAFSTAKTPPKPREPFTAAAAPGTAWGSLPG